MTRGWHSLRTRSAGALLGAAMFLMLGASEVVAQSVPVTVEVRGSEQPPPIDEPPEGPTDGPTSAPTDPPTSPTEAPPSDTTSPAPPVGEEPPPAAADPPNDPLARTGTEALRTVRDAAALIAAGLLLLIATKKPERNTR